MRIVNRFCLSIAGYSLISLLWFCTPAIASSSAAADAALDRESQARRAADVAEPDENTPASRRPDDGADEAAPSAEATDEVPKEASDTLADEMRDAIQVFRRETAREGLRGAGSGSSPKSSSPFSSLHGRVFEYFRNNVLDAVPHEVVQRGGNRNILRRNQFGFSVSGPVVIPKLYHGRRSTFFTFSYEGTRERVGRSYLYTLPTAQQRLGDFSDLVNKAGNPVGVYDPAGTRRNPVYDPARNVSRDNLEYDRVPFPNNQLPLSRIDPVARAILPHYPQPNTDVGPFLRNNYWTNPSERNSPNGFVARLDHSFLTRHKVTADLASSDVFRGNPRLFDTIGNPGLPDRDSSNRRAGITETFIISPNSIYEASFSVSSQATETAGLRGEGDIPAELGLEGVSGSVFPAIRFRTFFGLGASAGSYFRNAWNTYRTTHSLSLRRGRQSWSVVSSARFYQLNTLALDLPSGEFRFNDELTGLPGVTDTGSSFASFLVGQAYQAEATDQLQPSYLRRTSWQNTISDEIEISSNLTATLSVNVDITTPRVDKYDRQSTLDMDAVNPANGSPGALIFAARDGNGRAFQPLRVRFEPLIGLAWSPTASRNTVLRGSFRHMYGTAGLRPGAFATQGFSARRFPVSPNQQLTPAVVLADGFPALAHELPYLEGDAANNSDVDFIPQTSLQPQYRFFIFEFEQRLFWGLSVEFIGRQYLGRDLLVSGASVGLNRLPVSALAYRDQLNNEEFRSSLRPLPQYQRIRANYQLPAGRYLYRLGDLSIRKRTSNGLSFDLEYSQRNRWDDYSGPGIQDPQDREFAWARSQWLRPHRLSMNYQYDLPFGDGKALLGGGGLFSAILGDWSISGFTNWASGNPVVLQPEFNNTGGIVPYLRVNSVPGVDPHVANPSPEMWFNPAAFADPDDFTLGNVPRTTSSLRNPGYNNHDIAVTKRVGIGAEHSVELQLQAFNFLNHANWNDPDATIGPANARNQNAGKIIGSRGGRVVQLGLRYNF